MGMNNSTMCNESFYEDEGYYYDYDTLSSFFSYSILLTACIGVPVNLFVLGCSIYFIATQVGKLAPLIYHYFILSITAADLIFLVFFAGTLVLQDRFEIDIQSGFCRCRTLLTHMATVASSTSLLCLNIDKFVAIVRPLHHVSLMTKRLALAAIAGCWMIAFCWTMLFTYGPWTDFHPGCHITVDQNAYMIFSLLFFIGPVSVAAILSSTIAVVASKAIPRGGSVKFGKNDTGQRCASTRSNKRFGKLAFVFSTTFWSCISCLPYRIYYIVLQSEGVVDDLYQRTPVQETLIVCFYALMISYPTGNALVTLATQRRYRAILTDCLVACFVRKKVTEEMDPCLRRASKDYFGRTVTNTSVSGYKRASLAVYTVPEVCDM